MGLPSVQPPRRIGMLGGAFDPPHALHRALARAAVEQLALDELRIVPTGGAWHKRRPLTPAPHRLAMAALAFADMPRTVIDGSETRRSGPSYTVDTLAAWQAAEPDAALFLVMGADQSRLLNTWHRWHDLLSLATLCIAERADSAGGQARVRSATAAPAGPPDCSGCSPPWSELLPPDVLAALPTARPPQRLAVPPMSLSATQIRQRVATGQPVDTLVSPPVARYIADHQLYQTPDETHA